jgi:S-formylglutathione hydrolase FrmB
MPISRRQLLIGGSVAGLGVVGAGVGVAAGVLSGGTTVRRLLGMTGTDGTVPAEPVVFGASAGSTVPAGTTRVQKYQFASAARGRQVELITMLPLGTPPAELPVCLALHGRGGNAQAMVDAGLPQFLTAAVQGGAPPFAFVSVDGGDASYWVAERPGDDPQSMLTTEMPGWLSSLGLRRDSGVPRAALGISMGGFGSLVYARGRVSRPLAVVAAISPALFTSWGDADARHVFADQAQWQADEPLRHVDALPSATVLGVWCGKEDPFYPAATQLATTAHAAVATFDHGEHNQGYWSRVLPAAIGFLAPRLS